MNYRISIGSESQVKGLAVLKACETLEIQASFKGYSVRSCVSDQPIGMEETLRGATHRAFDVRILEPGAISIGIENGLVREQDGGYSDFAYVAVLLPDMQLFCAPSEMLRFPREDVEIALERGVTAGSVIAERTGCDPADPHSLLTNGRKGRGDFLVEPLVKLLKKAIEELS